MRQAAEGPGLVQLRVGPMRIYLVSHPEYVRHVLVTGAKNYHKGSIMDGIRTALGNGLFTADGELWRKQRRTMQPAFHSKELARFGPTMQEVLARALDRWQNSAANAQPVDMLAESTRLNIEFIFRALLGTNIDAAYAERLRVLTDAVFIGMTRRVWTFFVPPWLPIPGKYAYRRAVGRLDAEIYALIAACRAAEPGSDLLGRLLEAIDPVSGEQMSDRQVRDEIFTLFVAGYESTATGLSWVWHLLGQAPAVRERLHAELDDVLAGRTPTLDHLPQLRYTRAVLSETFRLYPAFPMYFRSSIDADTVGEYDLPAGAQLVISPYATHRDPRYWTDPEVFDPDRFSAERFDASARRAYYPFGMGQRRCIGEPMSLAFAQLAMATIAQRFVVRPERAEVSGRYAMTYQPKDGLPAILEPR